MLLFITDKLIYLQMQKTGCTHIASLLSKYLGGVQYGKHNWLKDYNHNKMIVGSIRNPWDWYVSLWAFGCGHKGNVYNNLTKKNYKISVKKILSNKEFVFKDIYNELRKPVDQWKSTYNDFKDPTNFKKWLKLIMDPHRKMDLREGYAFNSISNFSGFMTYRYCKLFLKDFYKKRNQNKINTLTDLRMFDKEYNILNDIIKTESLEKDLIRILDKTGYDLTQEKINKIRGESKKRTNTSKHLHPSYYYDAETIDLVAKKEQVLIEKYNYAPPICT